MELAEVPYYFPPGKWTSSLEFGFKFTLTISVINVVDYISYGAIYKC